MSELLLEPDHFDWLISGLLADPTYGQAAGEMKTLKSTLVGFIEVGLASGTPIFGQFAPREPRPVLPYVGEGGRRLWTRRIRRISAAMGVTPGDLDLHPVFDVAPVSSLIFQESLQRDLEEIQPGLVTLDPWYTYHGAATSAANLHQEGALLNQLSGPCMTAGASLLMVNHMNQTGSGMSLKRITMAGSGEWADSWLLLEHREQPDVENGLFRLTLEVGSRQWGGTTWHLDLDIGRFDVETGSHDGQIAWDLRRGVPGGSSKPNDRAQRCEARIIEALADEPFELTRAALKVVVGGSREVFDQTMDDLVERGLIRHDMVGTSEAGTVKRRLRWGLVTTQAEATRPSWDERDN